MLYRAWAVAFLVWLGLLAGCSSNEPKNEPVELQKIQEEIQVKKLWRLSAGRGSDGNLLLFEPAVVGDQVYVVDIEGKVAALNRFKGTTVWRKFLDEPILGGVGADTKRLYLTSREGELITLNIADGSELWRKSLSSEVLAPAQSNGTRVVVSTIDGNVLCFDAATGELKWRYDSETPVLSVRGSAPPVIYRDSVYVGLANGELVGFDLASGKPQWEYAVGVAEGRTELERLVDVDGAPKVVEGRIFVVSYQGRLVVLDALNGAEIWSKRESSYRAVDVALGRIYVSTAEGEVVSYDQTTGNEVWRQSNLKFRQLTSPQVLGSTLVVGDFEGHLHFLSLMDGRFLARVHADTEGVRGGMLVVDNLLYVLGNSGKFAVYKIQN